MMDPVFYCRFDDPLDKFLVGECLFNVFPVALVIISCG
jgi:hypothetical protein